MIFGMRNQEWADLVLGSGIHSTNMRSQLGIRWVPTDNLVRKKIKTKNVALDYSSRIFKSLSDICSFCDSQTTVFICRFIIELTECDWRNFTPNVTRLLRQPCKKSQICLIGQTFKKFNTKKWITIKWEFLSLKKQNHLDNFCEIKLKCKFCRSFIIKHLFLARFSSSVLVLDNKPDTAYFIMIFKNYIYDTLNFYFQLWVMCEVTGW